MHSLNRLLSVGEVLFVSLGFSGWEDSNEVAFPLVFNNGVSQNPLNFLRQKTPKFIHQPVVILALRVSIDGLLKFHLNGVTTFLACWNLEVFDFSNGFELLAP